MSNNNQQPNITHYRLVTAHREDDLDEEVNNQIRLGWQPQGGVAVCQLETGSALWSQAMVLLASHD